MSAYGWKNIQQELKFVKPIPYNGGVQPPTGYETDFSTQYISEYSNTPYNAICCNIINQGTDITNREGRQVKLKYLELTGTIAPADAFTHQAASNLVHEQVRMLVVIDHCNNQTNTAPALNLILDGTSASDCDMNSHQNLDYRKRFRIVRDKIFTFGWGSSEGGGGMQSTTITEKIPLNMKCNFSTVAQGQTATQSSLSDIAVWVYFFSRNQGIAGQGSGLTNFYRSIRIDPRLRFTE